MRYYLDKADAQKVKKIQQSLKKADLELVKIERANKKTKDPVVAKKVKESRSRIKKVLLTLGKWGLGILGMGATIAGLTLEMYGIAKGVEWLEDRANRSRREQRAQALEQEAQNRFNQYRLEHGRPPANGGNGAQMPANRNNNAQGHIHLNPVTTGRGIDPERLIRPIFGEGVIFERQSNEDREIARMAQQRAAERAAARQAAQAARETAQAANNANMAIGQAQDAIRELDLDNRPGGPVNSPGDQGARFGGLDLDAGYKVRRPKKHRVVTHDSMPWSKRMILDDDRTSAHNAIKRSIVTLSRLNDPNWTNSRLSFEKAITGLKEADNILSSDQNIDNLRYKLLLTLVSASYNKIRSLEELVYPQILHPSAKDIDSKRYTVAKLIHHVSVDLSDALRKLGNLR